MVQVFLNKIVLGISWKLPYLLVSVPFTTMVLRCYFHSQQLCSTPRALPLDLASCKLVLINQSSCQCVPPRLPNTTMIIILMVLIHIYPLHLLLMLHFGLHSQKAYLFSPLKFILTIEGHYIWSYWKFKPWGYFYRTSFSPMCVVFLHHVCKF